MHDRLYSTADLARICGVSISTIKRWTDSGALRCVRTPGGHRKFRMQDVADAAHQMQTSPVVASEPQPGTARLDELAILLLQGRRDALVERACRDLELGEDSALRDLLIDLHRHGMSRTELGAQVLEPALTAIRMRPANDYVLRRAARIAQRCLCLLAEQVPAAGAAAPVALVAMMTAAGDSIWPELCGLILTESGWRAVDLGRGVSAATIRLGLALERPRLVVLGGAPQDPLRSEIAADTQRAAATLMVSADGEACTSVVSRLRTVLQESCVPAR